MNNKHIKVLLIEDNPGDARLIQEMLAEAKGVAFDLELTNSLSSGLKRIEVGGIDLILLDLSLPDSQGLNTFTKAHAKAKVAPIIVLSGLDDEELAVKAVQEGAQDYLVKGIVDSNLLARSIRYAIERKQAEELLKQHAEDLQRANIELKQALDGLLKRVEKKHIPASAQHTSIRTENSGGVFLYPIEEEASARSLFLAVFDTGLPALAVVRTPPQKFCQTLGRDVETIWLTTNTITDTVCLNPSNITRLSMVLTEFYKRAPEGVVLFEGVEYLLSIVGFQDLLSLIQFLNDKMALNKGAVYMILDMGVLDEKEVRHIQRECLPPQKTSRL